MRRDVLSRGRLNISGEESEDLWVCNADFTEALSKILSAERTESQNEKKASIFIRSCLCHFIVKQSAKYTHSSTSPDAICRQNQLPTFNNLKIVFQVQITHSWIIVSVRKFHVDIEWKTIIIISKGVFSIEWTNSYDNFFILRSFLHTYTEEPRDLGQQCETQFSRNR